MKKIPVVLLLLMAACGSQPVAQNPVAAGGAESSVRYRARIHTDLGSGYYAQGRLAVSLEEFSTAAQIDSGYAPAYNGLGLVYAALKEDDKAEGSFKRSLQLDSASSETHNNYGTFLCSRGRYDESVNEFLVALKNPLYPTPESAWLNAGTCALKKGDDKSAETYFNNALQVQPDLRGAYLQLAQLHSRRGETDVANQHFQKFMQMGTEVSADALLIGVRIAREAGDKNAEASYSMLLRNKYPNSEQAKTLRGEGE